MLTEWFGHARTIYNDALRHMREACIYKEYGPDGLKSLFTSERIRGERNPYFDAKPFLSDLPATSRKYAVIELVRTFRANRARQRTDPRHRFELKFRTKKGAQHIHVESAAVRRLANGRVQICPRSRLKGAFEASERSLVDFDHDCVVQKDALGRYWLIAPRVVAPESQGGADERGCCAIDPGVRTFCTVYDPDFGLHKLGNGAATRVFRLLLGLDGLLAKQAAWDERPGRSRRRVARYRSRRRLAAAIARARERVKNLVSEMHWKVAGWLTERYRTIVVPPFETKGMARKHGRKLNKKSVRQLLGLSHYAFRQRLLHKASLRGCSVHVLGEEYTSKTCTQCGEVNRGLGGAKVFRCPSCGIAYDRDAGGARNIFIKNYEFLHERPSGPMPR